MSQTSQHAEPFKQHGMKGHPTNWLLTVDDTIWSYHAFMYLKDLIQQTKGKSCDKLYILHVSTPFGGLLPSFVSKMTSKVGHDVEQDSSTHAMKLLLYYGKLAQQYEIDYSLLRSRSYKPADMIIECASRYQISHVIMGQRGASDFMKKYILGSTCKEVLEHLPHSNVTIVKRAYDDGMTEENLRHQVHILTIDTIYTQDKLSDDPQHHFAHFHMKPSTDSNFVPKSDVLQGAGIQGTGAAQELSGSQDFNKQSTGNQVLGQQGMVRGMTDDSSAGVGFGTQGLGIGAQEINKQQQAAPMATENPILGIGQTKEKYHRKSQQHTKGQQQSIV